MEINVLRYLTPGRGWNAFKLYASYLLSNAAGTPYVWGMPVFYFIEPTNHCNFKCPECPSGLGQLTRPLGVLRPERFKPIIDEIAPTAMYVQLYMQGEPYINKFLPEMIAYAQSKNLYVAISTNGSFINEQTVDGIIRSAPDKLIFSLDGLDEESYRNYRVGGTFAQADAALRMLCRRKKELGSNRPYVEIQFIVMKQNEHQLKQVLAYGKDVGVDKVRFKSMQLSSLENARKFMPASSKYTRYRIAGDTLVIKNKLKNRCMALWQTGVITWDGVAVPCCFDKDAEHPVGTVAAGGFASAWSGEQFRQFRSRVLTNRRGVPMCTNCSQGLSSKLFTVEF